MTPVGETGASSASGHVRLWLYLACKLRYGAGKHIWRLLVTSLLHEYTMAALLKGTLILYQKTRFLARLVFFS